MNVLSIDFDIIMAPDINLYNGLVGPSENGEREISKLINDYPMLGGCRADLGHYQRIVNLLMSIIEHLKVEDIRISYNHEDIKNVLNTISDVTVYTIDHHHDLGYPNPDQKQEDIPCTCANWGDFYFKNGTISKFVWLKNSNSDIHPDYINDDRTEFFDFGEFDFDKNPIHFDKLFICLSPEWVPEMYHPLFYTILDMINRQKNCHLEIF